MGAGQRILQMLLLILQLLLHFPQLRQIGHVDVDQQVDWAAIHPVHTIAVDLHPNGAALPVLQPAQKVDVLAPLGVFQLRDDVILVRVHIAAEKRILRIPVFRHAEKGFELVVGIQQFNVQIIPYEILCHKPGNIVISDGLGPLHFDQIVHVGDDGVGNGIAVQNVLSEEPAHLHPKMPAALYRHAGGEAVACAARL